MICPIHSSPWKLDTHVDFTPLGLGVLIVFFISENETHTSSHHIDNLPNGLPRHIILVLLTAFPQFH
jgi:hypothetical protein